MSSHLRPLFDGMPTPAESLAILVGLAEVTVFGIGAFANPTEYAKSYGIPITSISATKSDSTSEAPEPTKKALVTAIATRNLTHGVLLLTVGCYARDRRALGLAFATGLVTSAIDIMNVRTYGLQDAVWGHVFGGINFAALAASLLCWRATDPWW